MKFVLKLVLMAIAVFITARYLPFVVIESISTAFFVVVLLSILNSIIKPILIILTIPITLITFGLFLLIINGLMVYLTDFFIDGFAVSGLFNAIIFSLIISLASYIIDAIVE